MEITTDAQMMSELAASFPTLAKVPGVRPWDPVKLAEQLDSPARTSASTHAIIFVLSVWNTGFMIKGVIDLSLQPFDMHAALLSWDDHHRQAFLSWANNPWWA